MNYNYLTIGNDCSPAAALRNLNIREFALPFDWVVSTINALEKCFESNFAYYHKNLVFNCNKTRLIDFYGFEFPHDYPLNHMVDKENEVGEGVFGEESGKHITDEWINYYDIVLDKYNRRIERFKNIITDTKPIIVLCRYNTEDVIKLQEILMKYYNKENIYFVNSSTEEFENDKIKNIHTEANDVWNDATMWKQGIDIVSEKMNITNSM